MNQLETGIITLWNLELIGIGVALGVIVLFLIIIYFLVTIPLSRQYRLLEHIGRDRGAAVARPESAIEEAGQPVGPTRSVKDSVRVRPVVPKVVKPKKRKENEFA